MNLIPLRVETLDLMEFKSASVAATTGVEKEITRVVRLSYHIEKEKEGQ